MKENDITINQDQNSEINENNDLIGGLDIETSEDIEVPDKLLDQVIGQDFAREIIEKAAKQHRHVMMIGSPGTGKSMLSKAMTEIMPKESLKDILVYENEEDDTEPIIRTVPAGKGQQIIDAYKNEVESKKKAQNSLKYMIMAVVIIYGILSGSILLSILVAAVIWFVFRYIQSNEENQIPNLLVDNSDRVKPRFEDASGAHDGALLGDVRHDPFQSGGMGTPSHERVEPGSIHKAHKGVLFIDEINTLDVKSQQKLMTAIQEGEFSITGQSERSSGAMVQTEPVPTDFILVAAGNMDAIENMHPALRDRIEGYGYEIYMDDKINDTPEMRRKFARFVAQEVERDGSIPHFTKNAIGEVILEAQRRSGEKEKLTLKLRNLGGIIRTAGDVAKNDNSQYVMKKHVLKAKEQSKSIEQQYTDKSIEKKNKYNISKNEGIEIGRVNGLAVMGKDSGILLPVMSRISKTQNKGKIISTGKLQEIAEESISNVSAIIKDLDYDISKNDIHIQFVQTYEGVDGDSASITVATAVISALSKIGIKQNVAMTGSLSVRGDVLPVGGVTYKIEAAAKSNMDTVIIPKSNKDDVMIEEKYKNMVDIKPVSNIIEVLEIALEDTKEKEKLIKKLYDIEGFNSSLKKV